MAFPKVTRTGLLIGVGMFGTWMTPSSAEAGKIVVANDDWTLSDFGFQFPNDPGEFAKNIASFFTGGGAGSFLVYSNNFGLTEPMVAAAATGAGHSWTVQTSGAFPTPAQLAAYDGVFLGGSLAPAPTDLTNYVQSGGNVYLFGGGIAPASAEPTQWNPFLNAFGLGFAPTYNNVHGSIPISNTAHPLFANVSHLYSDGGHDVLDLDPVSPDNQIIEFAGGGGVYGVYVPTPGSLALAGLGCVVTFRRRRD